MQAQPSAQGIASLYMGNPGALQQRVKTEQQGKPGLPPDLGKLMALNIVTNEQDAAKRQQALNAVQQSMGPTGQMPTVAQSLEAQAKQKIQAQMLQQQRQQQGLQALAQQAPQSAIPEQTPQPEAQPQGIDQLPVDMEFCGGGIVAFAEGDEVGYETPYDRMNRKNRERAAAEEEARIAEIKASGNEAGATTYGEQMRGLGAAIDRMVPDPVQMFRRLVGDPSLRKAAPTEAAPQADYSNEGRREPAARAIPPVGGPAPRGVPPAVAPAGIPAAARAASTPAPAAAPSGQQGLGALLEQTIRSDLGRDREAEAQRMSEQYAKMTGHDQYAKQLQDILGGRQKAVEEAKAGRTPEWVKGLQALSGAPVRGGLGMMLGQAGAAATKAREAYGEEDLKFTQEMDKLREAAARAQLEGNTAKAKTYMDAYKEVDSARRSALTSGTSLENTREAAEACKQIAKDAAANRAIQQAGVTDQRNMANAINAVKNDEVINTLQKQLEAAMKLPTQANQAQVRLLRDEIERRQNAIYKRFGVSMGGDTMPAAPGAASPGGTMSGWGKAQVVK